MLHHAITVREDGTIHGKGLVASAPIRSGEVVWTMDDGGRRVPCAEVATWPPEEQEAFHWVAYQCSDSEMAVCEGIERYMNHSCDPNTWWADDRTLVARRGIAAGEEVTYDYATTEIAVEWAMACACGSLHCRGLVTNHDYLDPAWQARYGDHLPSHVLRAIARALAGAARPPLCPASTSPSATDNRERRASSVRS